MKNHRLTKLSKKGVAGMELYLSVIVMVFLTGMIIFAFVLGGNKISNQLVEYETISASLTGVNTVTVVNSSANTYPTGVTPSALHCALSVVNATNSTGSLIASGNYSVSGCYVTATSSVSAVYNNTLWKITGSWSYSSETNASIEERAIITDTSNDVGEARTFFGVFITIAGLVVVILLVLLLVRATKSEGVTNGA